MIIFQKLSELFKNIFGLVFEREASLNLFNFYIIASFFFCIFLICYWFYLEKKLPLFRKFWSKQFQTAKEANENYEILDIKEEIEKTFKKFEKDYFKIFEQLLNILEDIFELMGYEGKDLAERVSKVHTEILNYENKEIILKLFDIKEKWFQKLSKEYNFNLPKEYLKKLFSDTLAVFVNLKVLSKEDSRALLQVLPVFQESDHHEESQA